MTMQILLLLRNGMEFHFFSGMLNFPFFLFLPLYNLSIALSFSFSISLFFLYFSLFALYLSLSAFISFSFYSQPLICERLEYCWLIRLLWSGLTKLLLLIFSRTHIFHKNLKNNKSDSSHFVQFHQEKKKMDKGQNEWKTLFGLSDKTQVVWTIRQSQI